MTNLGEQLGVPFNQEEYDRYYSVHIWFFILCLEIWLDTFGFENSELLEVLKMLINILIFKWIIY